LSHAYQKNSNNIIPVLCAIKRWTLFFCSGR
jgi:hypothetical protein